MTRLVAELRVSGARVNPFGMLPHDAVDAVPPGVAVQEPAPLDKEAETARLGIPGLWCRGPSGVKGRGFVKPHVGVELLRQRARDHCVGRPCPLSAAV
jgi:hypothetical protein